MNLEGPWVCGRGSGFQVPGHQLPLISCVFFRSRITASKAVGSTEPESRTPNVEPHHSASRTFGLTDPQSTDLRTHSAPLPHAP